MIDEITQPYREDVQLLKKLGLKIFSAEHGKETFFGTVENEQYKIDCFVTCIPAHFYKFIILNKDENETTILKTGSGLFSEYWVVADKIGRDLIRIEKIT